MHVRVQSHGYDPAASPHGHPHHGPGMHGHRGGGGPPGPPGLHLGYSPRHQVPQGPGGGYPGSMEALQYEYHWRQQQQHQQHQQQQHHHRPHHHHHHHHQQMSYPPLQPPLGHMYGSSPRMAVHGPTPLQPYGACDNGMLPRARSVSPRSRAAAASPQLPPSPRGRMRGLSAQRPPQGLDPAAMDYRMPQHPQRSNSGSGHFSLGSPPGANGGGMGLGMNGGGGGGGAVELGLYAPAPAGVLEFEAISRLLVANIKVGAVIGKGGSIVRQIREASGAKVTISDACSSMHDDALEDRTITCAGPFAAVGAAFGMILSHCGVVGFGDPLSVDTGAATGGPDGLPHVCRLLVPNSKAGGLIGRGGATIKAIREHSGARIEISSAAYGAPPLSPGGGSGPSGGFGSSNGFGSNNGFGSSNGFGAPMGVGGVMGGGAAAALSDRGVDRVVTITGTFDACLRAHHLIISRIMDMGQMPPGSQNSPPISPRHGMYPVPPSPQQQQQQPLAQQSQDVRAAGASPPPPSPAAAPLPILAMAPPPLSLPPRSPALVDAPIGDSPALSISTPSGAAGSSMPPGLRAPGSPTRSHKPPPLALSTSVDSPGMLMPPSPVTNAFSMPTLSLTPTGGGGVSGTDVSGSAAAAAGMAGPSPVARSASPLVAGGGSGGPDYHDAAGGGGAGGAAGGPGSFDYLACMADFFGGSSSKQRSTSRLLPTSPSLTKLTIKLHRQAMSSLGGTAMADIGHLSGAVLQPWGGGSFSSGQDSDSMRGGGAASMRKSRAWSADTDRSLDGGEEPQSPATAATAGASPGEGCVGGDGLGLDGSNPGEAPSAGDEGTVDLIITGTPEEVQLAQLMVNLRISGGSPHADGLAAGSLSGLSAGAGGMGMGIGLNV